jgi:ABC-2 type transport system permease protein
MNKDSPVMPHDLPHPPEPGVSPIQTPQSVVFAPRRVLAIVLRHTYVLKSSVPRLLELAYWPTVQMILWGFITTFFMSHSSWVAEAFGVLLAGVLLWDVMFRGNLGLSISFMEEMWSRNLGHLFVSPLRPYELVASIMTMSFIRTVIGIVPATLLAIVFYEFNIYGLGLPLISFFTNLLVFGWVIGLMVSAMILRFGLGAESLAWVAIFAFGPLSGIYYPIDTLPGWLQPIAWSLPPAHVFEGMRAVLFDGVFRWDLFTGAVALNVVYLAVATTVFLRTFTTARKLGLLLDVGE